MTDSYDREVVRQETAGEPVAPVRPVNSVYSSRTSVYRDGANNYRLIQVIWWVVGFIDTLIAIRFVLKLFGANPAPFVRFIYDVTWPLVAPFHGIFNTSQAGRAVLGVGVGGGAHGVAAAEGRRGEQAVATDVATARAPVDLGVAAAGHGG